MKKWTKVLGLLLGLAGAAGIPAAGSGDTAIAAETSAVASSITSYGPDYLIKNDGSLWVWGGSRSVPTQVPGLKEVKAVFNLEGGGLVVTKDLSVWKWQTNARTLAIDTVQVPELTDLTSLSYVVGHYIAVDGKGEVYDASLSEDGQSVSSFSPVTGLNHVAAAEGYSEDNAQGSWKRFLFLKQDGTVWTSTDELATFQPVQNLSGIIELQNNYALAKDGTLWTWPIESIYNPVPGNSVIHPAALTGITNIRQIQSRAYNSIAIDAASQLWFWGSTITGSSDGTTFHEQAVPLCFTGIKNVTSAYIIERSIVALTADGKIYTTSIGEDSITAGAEFKLLTANVTSMQNGGRHIIMQKNDGTLWGWGVNKNAQLGYANYDFSLEQPVPVQKPISVSLNGEPISFTNGVITRSGQNFVPLRSLFDKLGAIVAYKEEAVTSPTANGGTTRKINKLVTITRTSADKPALSISINTVSGETTVNGKAVTLATPPFIVNGTLYLPLRFISEQLGAVVEWLPQQEGINISMK
jgi:alpha-tubulin suppressor-like RCC1 family protein